MALHFTNLQQRKRNTTLRDLQNGLSHTFGFIVWGYSVSKFPEIGK